jgi:AcrR family transcriptional regulator
VATTLRRDAERNRLRILAAAGDAFAEGGLTITLDEIARRAGVGVGTVYRRFPNKELLIEALFEDRIGAIARLAEAALEDDDAWRGFTGFLERAIALQATDRGLREIVLGTGHGQERVARARGRIKPLVDVLVERAQAQGELRADFRASDVPLILFMADGVVDATAAAAPETWRRALGLVLDGLSTRRDAPSPLPADPLEEEQLDAAMRSRRA